MSPTARNSPFHPYRSRSSRAMEKPRPSPNLGKFTATTPKCPRSPAMAPGSSLLSSQTPRRPARLSSASRRSSHNASGTMRSPAGSSAGNLPSAAASSRCQGSATTFRSLIIAINTLLERFQADAPDHVDETLDLALAPLEVKPDELFDHVGNVLLRERRPDHLSDTRRRPGAREPLVAADRDLVPLLAVLVHAEDADVAHVVMAAGIHAARDVEVELADVVYMVEIVETALDGLRHRDRLG